MKKINDIDFEKKLAEAPQNVALFISGLYIDPTLEQLVGEDVEDYLLIVDDLANQIAYFILGLLTIQEFKENLAEVLYLEGAVEIQKAYDAINKYVLSKLNQKEKPAIETNKIEDVKLADSTHISHVDVLNEIENPTPSLNTTVDFKANITKQSESNVKSTTSNSETKSINNPNKTPISSNKSDLVSTLYSPTPVAPYTNPALNIATKLGQNLDTPSASIPKDIYVSKRPDPYHEPVDL